MKQVDLHPTDNIIRALVAKRDWNEVEEIYKNRKSPIGWEVSFASYLYLSPNHDKIETG